MDYSSASNDNNEWHVDEASAQRIMDITSSLVDDATNNYSRVKDDTGEIRWSVDENEEPNPEAMEVRREQRQALVRFIDAVIEYMADSNRHDLDICQQATRQAVSEYAKVVGGTILSKTRMESYERAYKGFRRGEPELP